MQTEVKTRIKKLRGGGTEVVMDLLLLPRGSGNRPMAKRLAAAFKAHPVLAPHVRSVKAGASKVTIHLTPSVALMKAIFEITENASRPDVPGQLPLFGVPA